VKCKLEEQRNQSGEKNRNSRTSEYERLIMNLNSRVKIERTIPCNKGFLFMRLGGDTEEQKSTKLYHIK